MILDIALFLASSIGIFLIVLAAAVGIFGLLSGIYKWIIFFKYRKLNKQAVECGMTAEQVANALLQNIGINDVEVKQGGFFRMSFFGNHYNAKKKIIYLRKNIFGKSSLTAVALASQKVAIAQKAHEGDKKVRIRQFMANCGLIAPIVFIPLILIGLLLDIFVLDTIGTFTMVFSVISLVYFIFGIVALGLNISVEKNACNKAMEYFEVTNLLNESEREDAKALYKTYITSYIIDFIYEILYVIWLIVKVIIKIFARHN